MVSIFQDSTKPGIPNKAQTLWPQTKAHMQTFIPYNVGQMKWQPSEWSLLIFL